MRRGAQPHDNPDKDFRTTLESSASKQSSTSKRKKATADAAGKNSSNTRQVDHGNQQAHRRPFVTSEMSQAAEGTGSKCERTSRQQQINKNGHNRQPAENIDMIEDGTLEKSDTTGIEHAKLEQGHNKKTDPAICDRCENSSELSPLCDKSPDCNRCRSDGFVCTRAKLQTFLPRDAAAYYYKWGEASFSCHVFFPNLGPESQSFSSLSAVFRNRQHMEYEPTGTRRVPLDVQVALALNNFAYRQSQDPKCNVPMRVRHTWGFDPQHAYKTQGPSVVENLYVALWASRETRLADWAAVDMLTRTRLSTVTNTFHWTSHDTRVLRVRVIEVFSIGGFTYPFRHANLAESSANVSTAPGFVLFYFNDTIYLAPEDEFLNSAIVRRNERLNNSRLALSRQCNILMQHLPLLGRWQVKGNNLEDSIFRVFRNALCDDQKAGEWGFIYDHLTQANPDDQS